MPPAPERSGARLALVIGTEYEIRRASGAFLAGRGRRALLPTVRDQLRNVLSLLDQRSYPDTVGRRLDATAAESRVMSARPYQG